MDGEDRAALEEGDRVVDAAVARTLGESDDDRDVLRALSELLDRRGVERQRDLGRLVLQEVSRQGKLGEDDELRARLHRRVDLGEMRPQVRLDVAEGGFDLSQLDAAVHGSEP